MVVSISLVFKALLIVATVAADQDGNYAYVRLNITQTSLSCVAFPETDICPDLNITVFSDALDMNVQSLALLNSSLYTLAGFAGANSSCTEAVIKQQCLGIPYCIGGGQGQAVDSVTALAECRRARKLCPTRINNAFLDCDAKAEQYKNQTLTFPKASCAIIQDPTGFCPDVEYKRYNSSLYEYTDIFKQMKSAIESLKGKTTDECYRKVKALACSNLGACSDDGKYLLALFNQKDCNNTVDCIPESDRQPIKSHLCSDAPDADNPNVQKVPYPTGYEPQTTSKATSLRLGTTFQLVVAVFSTYVAKHLVHQGIVPI